MSTAKFSRVIFFSKEHQKVVFPKSALHFGRVVEQPSTCPRVYFWKNWFFFGKKYNFWKPFESTKNFSVFLERSFSRVIKTAYYVSSWSLREKVCGNLLLSSIFFDSWAENFELSLKTYPQSVKIVSYVLTAAIRGKRCFSNKSKNYSFRGFGKKNSERLVKTVFHLFTANLWAVDNFLMKSLFF